MNNVAATMGDRKKPLTPAQLVACQNLKRIWRHKAHGLGLTQEKAGERLGMTQGAVSSLLNGRLGISVKTLKPLADLLEVEAAEIDPVLARKYHTAQSSIRIDQTTLEKAMRVLEASAFRDHPVSLRADMLAELYNALRGSDETPEKSLSAVLSVIAAQGRAK